MLEVVEDGTTRRCCSFSVSQASHAGTGLVGLLSSVRAPTPPALATFYVHPRTQTQPAALTAAEESDPGIRRGGVQSFWPPSIAGFDSELLQRTTQKVSVFRANSIGDSHKSR